MKVLLAEDEPVSRVMVEGLLQCWDYEVLAVPDGKQAWRALHGHDAPQLAILGWTMSDTAGIELVKRIRTQDSLKYTYVILLAAPGHEQDALIGIEAGSDDYLVKPVAADSLRARLHVGARILRLHEQLYSAYESCRIQANHDSLTGLRNRSSILELLETEFERSLRRHEALTVMMADVDHFKLVNDKCGHAVGDKVLREIADRVRNSLRGYDLVSRYGGEEFLIVTPGTRPQEAVEVAERIRRVIMESQLSCKGQVTLSIGVASTASIPIKDIDSLVRAADSALHTAKHRGRNNVCVAQSLPELPSAFSASARATFCKDELA